MGDGVKLGRRGFLALGAGGAAAAVLVGLRAWETGSDPSGLVSLVGDHHDGVEELGRIAIADGVVADADAALVGLPAQGLDAEVLEGRVHSELTDPGAFVAAFEQQVGDELAEGDLVVIAGYLLAPVEVALASAVHLSAAR